MIDMMRAASLLQLGYALMLAAVGAAGVVLAPGSSAP